MYLSNLELDDAIQTVGLTCVLYGSLWTDVYTQGVAIPFDVQCVVFVRCCDQVPGTVVMPVQ